MFVRLLERLNQNEFANLADKTEALIVEIF